MPDPATGGPSGFFFPSLFGNVPAAQSYEALQARRKIAEAMIARQTKFPTNVGQGLSAIGEAIGERNYYNSVLSDEAASKGYEGSTLSKPAPAPSTYVPYSPGAAATTPPPPATGPRSDDTTTPAPQQTSDNYGYRPAPAYLQPYLASSGLDPERQAYLGHLAGKEAQSASEVSPTGAAGPFQFTRGTGAQYGIPGAARFDPKASIAAASRLTDDNAATLGRALGRPPTGPELALAHQQGAGTAAKMLLGTGNAPASNLAVNNASGGPQEAARKIMSYYGMPGGGGPRDQVAAAAMPPPTVTAAAAVPDSDPQEARLNDVVGLQKAPTSGYAFPPTANARTGDVQSDASPLGIRPTGGLGGDSPAAASVADTVQARGNAIQGPIPITPEPNPSPPVGQIQTAQVTGGGGGSAVAGPTATDVSRAPQLGGPPQIQPLGDKPAQPQLLPTENARTQHFEAIAADPRLPPTARANAKEMAQVERAQINSFNAQKIQEYNFYLQRWLDAKGKREDPSTQLDVYKKQMELTPDQINDLSPQEKAVLGDLPPGVRVYKDAMGKLQKIVGPQSVTVDQRGENEEAKVSGQLAAKRADATIQAGEAADETKFNIARARAMLDQIKTGAFQDGKTNIAAIGRGLGVSDEFLTSIGLDPKGIGTKQAFQAVVNELAMGKIGAGGMPSNNFSEGDRKFLEKTVISLGDDDEANRIKLAAADLVADRKREKASAWGDWQDNPDNKGGYGAFERKWNKDMRSRNDSVQLQKDADAWLAKARGGLPSPPLEFSPQEKADAIKWIGENQNSPKVPAIKQRYGLP